MDKYYAHYTLHTHVLNDLNEMKLICFSGSNTQIIDGYWPTIMLIKQNI